MAFKSGTGTIQRFFEITPQTLELSFTGSTSSAVTANFNSNLSTTATHVLCDIFVTRSTYASPPVTDHQNYVFGRSGQVGNHKNWVDSRGQQPSGQFSNMAANIIILTQNGESDGYGDNYGLWYSSQIMPTSGRTFYWNNFGNSGSSGWIFIKYRGYYESEGN